MRLKIAIRTLIFGLFVVSLLYAQTDDRALFQQGVAYYEQGQYAAAQRQFFTLLKDYPHSKILTATKLMLAKTYYKLGDYKAAMIVCHNFLQVHPHSLYLDDIHFLMGKIYYRQGDYSRAVKNWLWIQYHDSDPRLREKAVDFLFNTVVLHFTPSQLSRIEGEFDRQSFSYLQELLKARQLVEQGRNAERRSLLESLLNQYPNHPYTAITRRLLETQKGGAVASNRILILKSDEDVEKEVSTAFVLGAMYAAYEMSQRNPEQVLEIDTVQVGGSVLSAVQNTMKNLKEQPPLAVVSPLNNDQTAALALLSRYEHFPFIAPLNSQIGLAELSRYTFQINPDAAIKGEFLADYAVKELGFKTFAILAPVNDYGETIVNAFTKTVEANGGEVVETQWYYLDTQDFSRQFKAIRHKSFYISFRDSVLQVDSTLTEAQIQEQFRQYLNEELFSDESGREIDSTQVPATGIDALFIPTYPEFIPFIAPQFAFNNIQCTLLGNEGWNDPQALQKQRSYLDGLIYVTAGYFDPDSWNYKEFMTRFRLRMHTTPEIYHLLGYDIASWLMKNYRAGMSRQDFRDALEKSDLYTGIVENIRFARKSRVNSELNIIKFSLGQLIKVK